MHFDLRAVPGALCLVNLVLDRSERLMICPHAKALLGGGQLVGRYADLRTLADVRRMTCGEIAKLRETSFGRME